MILEVKAAGAYGWQPTIITVPLSRKLGPLTLLDPSGPAWPVGDDFYMKKQIQIFDARQEVKGHLENLGTNSTTTNTDISQIGRKGVNWAEVAHSVFSRCVSCCFAHITSRTYCLFTAVTLTGHHTEHYQKQLRFVFRQILTTKNGSQKKSVYCSPVSLPTLMRSCVSGSV